MTAPPRLLPTALTDGTSTTYPPQVLIGARIMTTPPPAVDAAEATVAAAHRLALTSAMSTREALECLGVVAERDRALAKLTAIAALPLDAPGPGEADAVLRAVREIVGRA